MSMHLQRQFDKLKKMILSEGAMVEQAVFDASQAISQRDAAMAEQVIEGDLHIDLLEVDVEEEILHTLACYQPVAQDLRFVISILKINHDLERIGDLAVTIAKQAEFLSAEDPLPDMPIDLADMADKARTMLKNSLDSLVNNDASLAQGVREMDDQVDEMHRQTYEAVESHALTKPEHIRQLVHLLNTSRSLERIADHAVNIAKDVIYLVQGTIVRHSSKRQAAGK